LQTGVSIFEGNRKRRKKLRGVNGLCIILAEKGRCRSLMVDPVSERHKKTKHTKKKKRHA
jgi:hypothetical protein